MPAGYATGLRARVPLIDMPTHLRYLERRLVAAGGTVERRAPVVVNCSGLGAPELVPDPATAEAIVARCTWVRPELAGARVVDHRMGLRPARPRVRLAVEELPGGTRCVHNYGHGGAGVTVVWGCAREAAALAPA